MHNIKMLQRLTPKLVGVTGLKGTGKDTVASHLCDIYGFRRFAYADILRDALVRMFGVSPDLFTEAALKEVATPELFGQTPRYLMQTLGTEWGRDIVSPTLWIDLMFRQVEQSGSQLVVVSDVRFDHEAEAIRSRGGKIWRVIRPDSPYFSGDVHRSEAGISDHLVDTTINNNMDKRTLFTQVGVAIAEIDRNANRPGNGTPI